MNGASWEEFFIIADCHGGCCIQPALDEVREGFENMTHHPLYLISLCSSSLTFFPPLGPCCAWLSSRCNCNASHFYSESVLATDGLLWFIIAWIQRSYFCSPPCGAQYLRSYGFRLHPPFSKWMLMSCNVSVRHLVHSWTWNMHVAAMFYRVWKWQCDQKYPNHQWHCMAPGRCCLLSPDEFE